MIDHRISAKDGALESIRLPGKPILWLVGGVALLLVANGRWLVPPASWLALIGWLAFLERSPVVRGLVTGSVLFVLVQLVVWRGIIPAPGLLYYLIAGIYGLVYFLPLAVHRLIAVRIPGLRSTLVLPLAWVSIELVFQRWITPYGSWISLAYTQTDNLALMQLASLTGIAGISFLMVWLGSLVVWVLRPGRPRRTRWRAVGIYAAVWLAVTLFGHFRLGRPGPEGEAVRTAALVPSPTVMGEMEEALAPVRRGEPLSPSSLDEIAMIARRLNDDLLARSRREARAGARLVAWSETAGRVLESDEDELLRQASRLAGEESVTFFLAYGVWDPASRPPFENKVVAIHPGGEIAWHYHKAHPIAGAESPFMSPGDRTMQVLEAPYGRVGAVICHDLDFPALLRQASQKRIGLVIGPADDWPEITPLHAAMATLRAIENGFSLLRPTSDGRSLATDTRGRVIARLDYGDDAMVAFLTAQPVATPYGRVGDLFSWLCVLGILVMSVAAYSPSQRRSSIGISSGAP
jgi:apolipoprotein N-acyltransferase